MVYVEWLACHDLLHSVFVQ